MRTKMTERINLRILKDENENCTLRNLEGTVDRLYYCTFHISEGTVGNSGRGESPKKTLRKN
jgi:hypothetical protein